MKTNLLIAVMLLAGCAAELGEKRSTGAGGSVAVAVAKQALSTQTHVNCITNGVATNVSGAAQGLTPHVLAAACGLAMQYQSGAYACSTISGGGARCDLALGSGPTPLIVGSCFGGAGTVPMRNPPGGSLNIISSGNCGGTKSVYIGTSATNPPKWYYKYGHTCGQCTNETLNLDVAAHKLTIY